MGTLLVEGAWTEREPANAPSARLSHAMADTPDGVVLFGGGTLLRGGLGDTWLFEDGEWFESESDTEPPSRAGHDMALSEDGVVLFGGDGGSLLNDQWLYADDSWVEMCTDDSCGTAPTARSGLAVSYDAARGKLILFGGFDGEAAMQDTWEWDRETGWQLICGNECQANFCCEPPARHDHRMIYDSAKQRIVMFGGTDDASDLDDLWAYDAGGWHEIDSDGPSARSGHTFAFDPRMGVALLFGGTRGGNAVADTAWSFDIRGDTWSPLDTSAPAPVGREFAAMTFDGEKSEFVMFGGGDSGQYRDTWTVGFERADCLGAGGAAGAAGAPSE
jgi:hypothetical protein